MNCPASVAFQAHSRRVESAMVELVPPVGAFEGVALLSGRSDVQLQWGGAAAPLLFAHRRLSFRRSSVRLDLGIKLLGSLSSRPFGPCARTIMTKNSNRLIRIGAPSAAPSSRARAPAFFANSGSRGAMSRSIRPTRARSSYAARATACRSEEGVSRSAPPRSFGVTISRRRSEHGRGRRFEFPRRGSGG